MRRRAFLKGAGTVTVLAFGGGAWRAYDQGVFNAGEGPAYEPWKNWRSEKAEGPLELIRAAILAANPHNSQPWRFRAGESRVDLFAATDRNTGTIDPFLREMYIGLGCALENMLLAAQALGYASQLSIFPDPLSSLHVAAVDLSAGKSVASDLYAAIPDRRTNRGPYERNWVVTDRVLDALKLLASEESDVRVQWINTDEGRQRIADLTVQATEAIIEDAEQSRDSARWFRFKWRDVQQNRDGLTIDATIFPWYVRAAAKMLPEQSREETDQFWLKTTRDVQVPTTPVFGILAVRNQDDRVQQLQCGRVWQRLQLSATRQGIAMQPLNQLPQRAAREQVLKLEPALGNALRGLVAEPAWEALMVFRLGYPNKPALPSPRRAANDVLMS